MNQEQLSMQIVAINDAIQILARSGTMVQSHTKEIDGILKRLGKNEERNREIESLIHQSCDMKTKEMQEHGDKVDEKIAKVYDKAFSYAWQFAGVVGAVGIGFFYYTFSMIDNNNTAHAELELRQDEKADKIANEIFSVMREIKNDIGDIKSEVAVMKINHVHYQDTLSNHMKDEEAKWKGKH